MDPCFQLQNEMLLQLVLFEMGAQFQYFALKYPLVRVLSAQFGKRVRFLQKLSFVQPLNHHSAEHMHFSLQKTIFLLHCFALLNAPCCVTEQAGCFFLHSGNYPRLCFLKQLPAGFVLLLA